MDSVLFSCHLKSLTFKYFKKIYIKSSFRKKATRGLLRGGYHCFSIKLLNLLD